MSGLFSSHSMWLFGWAMTGAILSVVGMFFWSGQAHSRGQAVQGTPGPPPPIDLKKYSKYETATFGMG